MSYSINIPASAWSEQTITLDGGLFRLEMKFKDRTNRWYMTLMDMEGNHLLSEKKCVSDQTMTGLFNLPGMAGAIFVQRTYGTDDYPTYENFGVGKEFELVYLTEAEFTMLLQAPEAANYVPDSSQVKRAKVEDDLKTVTPVFVPVTPSIKAKSGTFAYNVNDSIPLSTFFDIAVLTNNDLNVFLTPGTAGSFDSATGNVTFTNKASFTLYATMKTDASTYASVKGVVS